MGTSPQMLTGAAYWETRARKFAARGRGLAAVCSYGMPAFYNHYIQCCQRRALLHWLPRVRSAASSALDIGCGVGRWSVELARRGHAVTGLDISPYMLERARNRAVDAGAACSFVIGDAATMRLDRTFDLILCVTVLQHILDPPRATAAISRMAAHLAPGGRLILLEAAPVRAAKRCDTAIFQARCLDWYRQMLHAAGLTLIAQGGVDPMPFKTWLMPHYRRLPRALAIGALVCTVALSLPLDWLLGPWLVKHSWHQVLVAERREGQGP